MAKNFNSAGSSRSFSAVSKKEQVKAQVVTIQNIANENLMDNPENGEDVSYTEDIELSIRQNGFTDPLEVTDFEMQDGMYMIMSGHRRRNAGVKTGMDVFPCIIRHFENKPDMVNYLLLSNSHRDSSKDPLLYARRWKLHEKYLIDSGFKGGKREEIARRLGMSVQQADRYAGMNKIILPVWDMVQAGQVGINSVQPLVPHTEEEQIEIYGIMQEALAEGVTLTRDFMKELVEKYREGARAWCDIANTEASTTLRESSLLLGGFISDEPSETQEAKEYSRNDEMRREYDLIAAEYDKMDADRAAWERSQEETGPAEDTDEEVPELTEREKREKVSDEVFKSLGKLQKLFEKDYMCRDSIDAEKMLNAMAEVAEALIVQMNNVAVENGLEEIYLEKKSGLISTIDGCI